MSRRHKVPVNAQRGVGYLREMLAWLKQEIQAAGFDIKRRAILQEEYNRLGGIRAAIERTSVWHPEKNHPWHGAQ
jgi:hypothetical protein